MPKKCAKMAWERNLRLFFATPDIIRVRLIARQLTLVFSAVQMSR